MSTDYVGKLVDNPSINGTKPLIGKGLSSVRGKRAGLRQARAHIGRFTLAAADETDLLVV
ncbi:hypothetical protein [Burkholderia sp. AU18528]|uniref:hypothetical protein n=1 Tax=Burkholderia sp. AU18528 TaxID=2015350 RepID=UPI0015D4A4BB|nr:hypothetical protein [Burkholderia sp. AU18528]